MQATPVLQCNASCAIIFLTNVNDEFVGKQFVRPAAAVAIDNEG